MDSVNKEVIQVRHSILGFAVILQISRQIDLNSKDMRITRGTDF